MGIGERFEFDKTGRIEPEPGLCRRCSGCANSSHHWMPNDDFMNDPEEAEHNTEATHICKHCPSLGMECGDCDGDGCGDCDDEGVNEYFPFSNME